MYVQDKHFVCNDTIIYAQDVITYVLKNPLFQLALICFVFAYIDTDNLSKS